MPSRGEPKGNQPDVRWSIARRLEFLDFRLYWDASVNRRDLFEHFGISPAQAASDLARYREAKPENLTYDSSEKAYVAAASFEPLFKEPSARAYLAQLRLIDDDALDRRESWIRDPPPFATLPLMRRRVTSLVLRKLLTAIRDHLALKVLYQSMNSPEPVWRWLTPHALVFDGRRWHARAWCSQRHHFGDFVISRFLDVGMSVSHPVDVNADVEWRQEVTLRIGPHPGLSEAQRRAIEMDYDMQDGEASVTMRVCLAYYMERQLLVDLRADEIDAVRRQVVLLNASELDAVRTRAQALAAELATGIASLPAAIE